MELAISANSDVSKFESYFSISISQIAISDFLENFVIVIENAYQSFENYDFFILIYFLKIFKYFWSNWYVIRYTTGQIPKLSKIKDIFKFWKIRSVIEYSFIFIRPISTP